jgi:hypothetical protein
VKRNGLALDEGRRAGRSLDCRLKLIPVKAETEAMLGGPAFGNVTSAR